MGNHAELLVQLLRATGWSIVELARLLKTEPLTVQKAVDGATRLSRYQLGLVLVAAGRTLMGLDQFPGSG